MSSFRDEGEVEGQVAYNLRSRKVMVDVGPSNRSKKQRLCERERERDEDKRQRDEIAKRNGWSFHSIDDDDPWGCLRKRDGLPNLIVYLNDIPRGKQPPGELLRNSGTPSVQQPCSATASSEPAYSEPGEPYTWNAKGRRIMEEKGWKMTDEERWRYWSNKMLDHYNYWKDAKFRLLKVIKVMTDAEKIHSNFTATESDDASSELFFGALYPMPNEAEEYLVPGACVLKPVDSGPDLKAKRCSLCCDAGLIHPTAYYGYSCASGTTFSRLEEFY